MTAKASEAWTSAVAGLCLVSVLTMTSGCAGSAASPFEEGLGSPQGNPLNVWIRNESRGPVTVTLLGTGGRSVEFERIGFGSEVVTVRWHGGLTRAQLEQLGGRRFTTRSITLTTEASVTITVADNLTRSTLRAN